MADGLRNCHSWVGITRRVSREINNIDKSDPFLREPANQSASDVEYHEALDAHWNNSAAPVNAKLSSFPRFVSREDMTKFLAREEAFKLQLPIHGCVIDLGVGYGGSLFTWLQLSSIYEPVNYTREIVGFDTFSGIPALHEQDAGAGGSARLHPGGFCVAAGTAEEIEVALRIHSQTRFLGHVEKVRIVRGPIEETLPRFMAENKHMLVSLLSIDVDTYLPTRTALLEVLPKMPKGSIVLFDEANHRSFPGETAALLDSLDIAEHRLRRFNYAPTVSYVRVGE